MKLFTASNLNFAAILAVFVILPQICGASSTPLGQQSRSRSGMLDADQSFISLEDDQETPSMLDMFKSTEAMIVYGVVIGVTLMGASFFMKGDQEKTDLN